MNYQSSSFAPLFHWLAATIDGDEPVESWREASITVQHPLLRELMNRAGAFIGQAQCRCSRLDSVKPLHKVEIESERIRLFQFAPGGTALPPYASWWLDKRLGGESAQAVRDFYMGEGLRASQDQPDYLPTMLSFLGHLIDEAIERPDDILSLQRTENDFLRRYLLSWIPQFCSNGIASTYSPFWSAIFDLLAESLATEFIRVTHETQQSVPSL